ncbi:hypothetical protein [Lysinibacillus sp. NPDC093216]
MNYRFISHKINKCWLLNANIINGVVKDIYLNAEVTIYVRFNGKDD